MFNCPVYKRNELGSVKDSRPKDAPREAQENSDTKTVGVTNIRLLPKRVKRHSLNIQVNGPGDVWMSIGVPAVIGSGFFLTNLNGAFFSDAGNAPKGEIFVIATAADTSISFVEVYE